PRLAARVVDANVPVAVWPRRMAEAVHGEPTARACAGGGQERLRRHAGVHDRLPGDARRDWLRGARGVRPRRRRATTPVPLSERSPGMDRGNANARASGRSRMDLTSD